MTLEDFIKPFGATLPKSSFMLELRQVLKVLPSIFVSSNMSAAFLFLLLTVADVAIVFTTALCWNIQEEMTVDEISHTFDTDDGSVPDHRVFSMKSPTTRRSQPDDEIHLKVEINGTEINLNFKPTDGYLATKNTPVWSAVTDPRAYQSIRYDPLPNAMSDIGDFKMYQDVNNEAAIVVYTNPDHDSIIEGVVTSKYAIKTLPKRLWNKLLKVQANSHLVRTPMFKRSSEPNADQVTGCYVIFKVSQDAKRTASTYNQRVKRQLSGGSRRSPPQVVYPEILIVLDHNAIRNKSITAALRFVFAFWNGVDMVYSALDDPKVRLNIAGIIVSADDAATPYIAEDTSIKVKGFSNYIPADLGTYFYKERVRFPLKQYDMVIAMTRMQLCTGEVEACAKALGHAKYNVACPSERQMRMPKNIHRTGVLYYNWMFGGVDTAAHETAHILGVDHDGGPFLPASCSDTQGFVMTKTSQFSHQHFKWSQCSKRFFRQRFASENSTCLDNEPIWTKPVADVLPGRWLSLDGQCQNAGYHKSCQVRIRKIIDPPRQSMYPWNSSRDFNSQYDREFMKIPVCLEHGCQAAESDECVQKRFIPLPGTKCDENKFCEDFLCVSES